MTLTPIQLLVCGSAAEVPDDERDERTIVLVGLGRLVNSYFDFCQKFKEDINSTRSSYFLPVALRSLMETATIALLARIDPLRVIHSSRSQDSENYIKSRQQASALKWKGDIISDDVTGRSDAKDGDKQGKQVWDPNIGPQKLPRALLSDHSCEAFWIPACRNSSKWLSSNLKVDSAWARELMNAQPDDFQKHKVGAGNRLYSELSKGIHPEFAVRREAEFDAATLATSLENAMKWVSTLAFISHFALGISLGVSADHALAALLAVEDSLK